MKVLAIGDPHGDLKKIRKIKIKDVDLILLTGDLGSANLMRKMAFTNIERRRKGLEEIEYSPKQQKKAFMEAYDSSIKLVKYLSKFAPVYLVYGNVESNNKETKRESKEIGLPLPFLTNALKKIKNVKIINNRTINFKGIRIGGIKYFIDTSWVKEFKPENYKERLKPAKKQTDKARKILKKFGYVDILLSHLPPFGVLDKVTFKGAPKHWRGKRAGSKAILDYIKKYQPRFVICGHIHEQLGMKKIGKTEIYNLGVAESGIIEVDN